MLVYNIMSLTQDQKNRIIEVVKSILLSKGDIPQLAVAINNAPFHETILERFRKELGSLNIELPYLAAIASWMHGLNTSLGTGFESISHILSGGYKRNFSGTYQLPVKASQASQIESIIRDLKAGAHTPDVERENVLLFRFKNTDQETRSLAFTIDCYIERENEIIAVELKSVRPNSGEGRGEKQKILYGKAALKLLNPGKTIRYYIGFPFDPTADQPTEYNKERFFNYLIEFKKFFAHDEVLIGSELWNFLSGSKETMESILLLIAETVREIRE